jgi:hypothetical protein
VHAPCSSGALSYAVHSAYREHFHAEPRGIYFLNLLADHLVREVSKVFGERLPARTPKDLKDLFGFLSECNQIL